MVTLLWLRMFPKGKHGFVYHKVVINGESTFFEGGAPRDNAAGKEKVYLQAENAFHHAAFVLKAANVEFMSDIKSEYV